MDSYICFILYLLKCVFFQHMSGMVVSQSVLLVTDSSSHHDTLHFSKEFITPTTVRLNDLSINNGIARSVVYPSQTFGSNGLLKHHTEVLSTGMISALYPTFSMIYSFDGTKTTSSTKVHRSSSANLNLSKLQSKAEFSSSTRNAINPTSLILQNSLIRESTAKQLVTSTLFSDVMPHSLVVRWTRPSSSPRTSPVPVVSNIVSASTKKRPYRPTVSKYQPDCKKVVNQVPNTVHITEHDYDNLLLTLLHGTSVNLSIAVILPVKLSSNLIKHFKLSLPNNFTTNVILEKPVDIEQIYHDFDIIVSNITLQITCHGYGTNPLNTQVDIIVEDIDDNGPVFQHVNKPKCAIPVYTAGTAEKFVGVLVLSPAAIRAVDGDLFNPNDVSYTFLHGDPIDYQRYFTIDYRSGNVNKTSNITATDPHDFVMIIQATEASPTGRSKVAVLTVSVAPPYEGPKSHVYRANKIVITVLQILSVVVIFGFTLGFLYVIRHRNRQCKVESSSSTKDFGDIQNIDDIEEYMIATSTNQVTTHIQTCVSNNPPESIIQEPSLLSTPSPAPKRSPIPSPVSARKVNFVLPEKTYRMIYGKRAARNVMKRSENK